ncbi:MAG: hypothetical protein ABI175_09530 [Polyangiales bacterium]
MHSSRSLALVCGLVLAACGTDTMSGGGDDGPEPTPDVCETSYLDYGNFGKPFALDWCRGCHSSNVPANMRQKAPVGVDFDTLADVQRWSERIAIRATGAMPTMPPAGGPSEQERALLAEWIGCGATQ